MNTTEQARDIIGRAREARAVLRGLGLTTSTIIHAPSVEVVREVARLARARLSTLPIRYMPGEPEHLMETAHLGSDGAADVKVLAADPRPMPKADPATCSECSGPLEDGMGCTPREGRCGSCVYEGAMRAAKAKQAREEGLSDRERMQRSMAAEHQRQQGEGYGPGREQ